MVFIHLKDPGSLWIFTSLKYESMTGRGFSVVDTRAEFALAFRRLLGIYSTPYPWSGKHIHVQPRRLLP
jgi:hypothetical protein